MESETSQSTGQEMPKEPNRSFSRRILSAESQISRFDRWIEFLSATVLALATVATAWCAYQSTLWGGDETVHRAAANAANVKSAQFSGQALQ